MELGHSKKTDTILRFISDESKYEIERFIEKVRNQKFINIKSQEELQKIFKDSINNFLNVVTQDELLDLRSYTGYNFKNINAVLRNNWTYEENGLLDEDTRKRFFNLSNKISSILNKFPSLPYNFITYRGTTIDSFSKYGINTINELNSMEEKYMFEEGFTSTSIIEDTSYFNKILETRKNYNVKIKYLITPEYDEGALLLNQDMSYSINQNEYLINKGSLSKVVNVEINEQQNQAVLTVILIPRKKWDLIRHNENKVKK